MLYYIMSYFSNPNFMYLQDRGNYNDKEIDKFIIKAYQKGKTKVVIGNKRYVVAKEIPRIQKTTKFHKPNETKVKAAQNNTLQMYRKDKYLFKKLKKYLKNKSTKSKTMSKTKKTIKNKNKVKQSIMLNKFDIISVIIIKLQ